MPGQTTMFLSITQAMASINRIFRKDIGFPVDASTESTINYISNTEIRDFLAGVKSKHTLLVADACFSGDIFRGKTLTIPYEKLYSLLQQSILKIFT